jgi:NADPH:quinone reductase-like Zn-dependent oxidoreductase
MSAPKTTRAWIVTGIHRDSFAGVEQRSDMPVPVLGDHDVLVRVEAVSLNYRDLAIPRVSTDGEVFRF